MSMQTDTGWLFEQATVSGEIGWRITHICGEPLDVTLGTVMERRAGRHDHPPVLVLDGYMQYHNDWKCRPVGENFILEFL